MTLQRFTKMNDCLRSLPYPNQAAVKTEKHI